MRNTRRYFTQEQKQEIVDRDGPLCVLCGKMGQDVDHAFRLSSYLPRIEESWNGNIVCRKCHTDITTPDTKQKHDKALQVMQLALHRAYKIMKQKEYKHHYKYYKSKLIRFKQLYE